MRRLGEAAAVVGLVSVLTACAWRAPEPPPEPRPAPASVEVLCRVPAEMTAPEEPPEPPAGEYTQREVAAYLLALHRWGARGWQRIEEIRAWSGGCMPAEAMP